MIELRVLGAGEVRRTGESGTTRIDLPPKQLALLAYVVLARPRGP